MILPDCSHQYIIFVHTQKCSAAFLQEVYELNIKINKYQIDIKVNKIMISIHLQLFVIPDLKYYIEELKQYELI